MKGPKILIGLVYVAVFCALFAGKPPGDKDMYKLNENLGAGQWFEKSGISMAPLYLYSPDRDIYYSSLDQATKAGDIKVIESESVNELVVENKSGKPVLLIAGEVVGGGKQDRMVGKDIILGAGKIRRINVFCVEQGRWRYQAGSEKTFDSAFILAEKSVRQKAQEKGGSSANQSSVWEEVSDNLRYFSAPSETSNYRKVLESDKVRGGQDIAGFFIETFGRDERIAGLALAYNGEVQSIEYFANPALFSRYLEKLVKSYVVSALREMEGSKPADMEMLKSFTNKGLADETHQYKTDDETVIESRAGDIESFELQTPEGKMVHYTRFRK